MMFGQYETATFTLRFTGENLSKTGVHIHDLATVLLAMNRMMNKAQLASDGNFAPGASPNRATKKQIALTIGERRRESDAFALVPMLLDPISIEYAKKIADYVASGIFGYYTGNALDKIKQSKSEQQKLFIGSIHADVVNIIERIDAPGGIDSVQIGSPQSKDNMLVTFNKNNKDKIIAIGNETSLGKCQSIEGHVYRLYPNMGMVTIRTNKKRKKKVNVFLSEADFELIRYDTQIDPLIKFTGHPRYRLGLETKSILEFEAIEIAIQGTG